jgi:hypothetical protein
VLELAIGGGFGDGMSKKLKGEAAKSTEGSMLAASADCVMRSPETLGYPPLPHPGKS